MSHVSKKKKKHFDIKQFCVFELISVYTANRIMWANGVCGPKVTTLSTV